MKFSNVLSSVIVLILFGLSVSVHAGNPTFGWDFDILKISSKGMSVKVQIRSRSNSGLDGPIMVICHVGGRDFIKQKVNFLSGETKTVEFEIPYKVLFPHPIINEYRAAKAITGRKPPAPESTRKQVLVSVKGGGISGIGYGLWPFDQKKQKLTFIANDGKRKKTSRRSR